MKTSLIERKIVQNFLNLENSFLSTGEFPLLKKNKKYLLGFRRGVYIINLEKSILNYFRVIKLLRLFQKSNLQTLFIGCPKPLNAIVSTFLLKFDAPKTQLKWSCDNLLEKGFLSKNVHLAVVFDRNLLAEHCLQKNIPIIGIGTRFNTDLVDFPILINFNSISTFGLLLYLIKLISRHSYK